MRKQIVAMHCLSSTQWVTGAQRSSGAHLGEPGKGQSCALWKLQLGLKGCWELITKHAMKEKM